MNDAQETPKSRKLTQHIAIPLRVSDNMIDRLERISEWIVERSPGMLPKLSYATRFCLLEGLAVAEARMKADREAKAKPEPEPKAKVKATPKKKATRRG